MSVTATRAPSAASRRQVAAPIPEAPPVTSAVRSASRKPRASLRHAASGRLGRLRAVGLILRVMRIGYKASAEQFGPVELLDFTVEAERCGFELAGVSDHFQPWRHTRRPLAGGAPLARAPRRSARRARVLGTSVLTPTLRYHPSVIAQAFATLGCLAPGRVFLGVGTGEAMNETPSPAASSRAARSAGSAWPRRSS